MEEEYLEEDIRSETDIDTQSEYIVIEEEPGEAEYLEEDDDDESKELLEETEDEEELKRLLKGDSESTIQQDVEFIYAEGVSENNEIIIGEVPRFACKYCDASFKRLDSLYKHNSVHKGKTICPVCKAVFSRVAHRTRHMKLKHPDVEVVKCVKRGTKRKKEQEQEIKIEDQSDAFSILSAI